MGWSVCMHPNPGVSATAASLIAELPEDPADPMTLWWIMKALGDVVMADPVRLTPVVQTHWQAWEADLLADWARDRRGIGRRVQERVEDLLRRRKVLDAELRRIS